VMLYRHRANVMLAALACACLTDLPECIGDGLTDGFGDWWREGVSDLSVGGCLAAGEFPRVGEALQPGDHAGRQLRHSDYGEVGSWDLVSDAKSVYTELSPGRSGSGRTEVGAAMFLAAADNRGSDPGCPTCPILRARPAAGAHQVGEYLADGGRLAVLRLRPAEPRCPGLT
jgi:hypothetical protein